MPGARKQHVVAGRQTTEYVILDHVLDLSSKNRSRSFSYTSIPNDQFSDFSALQLLPENQSMLRAGIDDHHAIFHLIEGGFVQQW